MLDPVNMDFFRLECSLMGFLLLLVGPLDVSAKTSQLKEDMYQYNPSSHSHFVVMICRCEWWPWVVQLTYSEAQTPTTTSPATQTSCKSWCSV